MTKGDQAPLPCSTLPQIGVLVLPVHNHSHYSALDGYSTPTEIAKRVASLGLPGAFLTDHGTVAGWMPFAKAMAAEDLFCGFGIEAYQSRGSRKDHPKQVKGEKRDTYHLILLAKNNKGLRNLMRLSDLANREGFYYNPRVDLELLEQYNEGIIATTACYGSLVCEGLERGTMGPLDDLCRIFADRGDLYVELSTYDSQQQVEMNKALVAAAEKKSLPLLVANDAHYPAAEDYHKHEMLLAMQMHKHFDIEHPQHPQSLYIMGEDEVRKQLDYLPARAVDEAVANTDLLMEQCKVKLPAKKLHLPKFHMPEWENRNCELLVKLAQQGMSRRYASPSEAYWDRLEYEIRAVIDAGLHDYFLIVWDFIDWAKDHGIMVGPGRGSAGGSLLAYCLDITNVDPMRYGLVFERFWNPGRSQGLPDIDVDFPVASRAKVKAFLARRYGENNVLQIGNHIRMRPKSALDKVAAAYYDKPPYQDLTLIKRIIDKTTDAGLQSDWPEIEEQEGEALKPYQEKYPQLFQYAKAVTGRISTYGVHASAVVVSDVPLPEELPAMLRTAPDSAVSKGDKVLATQLEMHGVEDMGFPKFDLLGLRNLDTLQLTVELAGETFNFRDHDYNTQPDSFWQQIDNGQTLGLFQIEEGHAARRIGRKLKPRGVEDLGAIVALNRPGPLSSGMVDHYLARRDGEEDITYPHAILHDILEPTYGDFLYQEQVLAYFTTIGYSLSEADDIRKILGKKLVEKMRDEYPRYVERASQFMPVATAESIWDDILGFSKYSFNKSHAVAYGTILAWTMYAKWRWPTEFILASIITNQAKVGEYIAEGRRLNVTVRPPDINVSAEVITKIDDAIYFGLRDIKGVGSAAAKWVINHRPYTSYEHFHTILYLAQEDWDNDEDRASRGRSPKQTVRKNVVEALFNAGAFDALPDGRLMPVEKLAEYEEELLGISLTDVHSDVIEANREDILSLDAITDAYQEEGHVSVPGVITEVRTTTTREDAYQGGRDMAKVRIVWEGEQVEFAAFPDAWDNFRYMLRPRVVGRFDLRLSIKGAVLERGFRYV